MSVFSACLSSTIVALGCGEMESQRSAESHQSCAIGTTAAWSNQPFQEQTGFFRVELEATPSELGIDAVVGLSDGPADHWRDLAAAIRFRPDGLVDARAGDAYVADTALGYAPRFAHTLRFDVDVAARTYGAWIRYPFTHDFVRIGLRLPFRTEQAAAARLDHVASFVDPNSHSDLDQPMTIQVCAVDARQAAQSADRCIPQAPGSGFRNQPLDPATAVMVARARVRATAPATDGVIGIAADPATGFGDLAAAVRFWTDGTLQARDGDTYRADTIVHYAPGQEYEFRFVIDLPSKTYSVFYAGPGPNRAFGELARNYRFRPSQLGATALDHLATAVDAGGLEVCDPDGDADGDPNGGPAGDAVYARRGGLAAVALLGGRALILGETALTVVGANGATIASRPDSLGGVPFADAATGNLYRARVDGATLFVDAYTPALVPRWTRSHAVTSWHSVQAAAVYADGSVAVAAGQLPYADRIDRFGADGTDLGFVALAPYSEVAIDRGGYVVAPQNTHPVVVERHLPDGALVWQRTYPGQFALLSLASADDGSFVAYGAHRETIQLGNDTVDYAPDFWVFDNSFVASFSPTGEPRFARFADSTLAGELATNGTHVVHARIKHAGSSYRQLIIFEVSGGFVRAHSGDGISELGIVRDLAIGADGRILVSGTMSWPVTSSSQWSYTTALPAP